jgi:hypothetical protein
MIRLSTKFLLVISLLGTSIHPVYAAEKCLANFTDSEWALNPF